MVARAIFGLSHAAIPFLLFLAIVDDALGLVVLAVAYPTGLLSLSSFLLWFGPALGACWILRRARVAGVWPYLLAGGVPAWFAFFRGGLHPALALVAVVPFMAGVRAPGTRDDAPDALEAFEHGWKAPVQVVLFLFGLTNAGVPLAGIGPGTWIVIAALVGKPAGIALATALATAVGLPRPAVSPDATCWSSAFPPGLDSRFRSSSPPRRSPMGRRSTKPRWAPCSASSRLRWRSSPRAS